jgi:hypothetical protein
MKLHFRLAFLAASSIALVAIAGCPVGTLIPGITPSATPGPITGKVNFNGGNTGQQLTLGLKKFDGQNWNKTGITVLTDSNGNYTFPTNSAITPGQYQVFYDDGGQVVTSASVNTDGVFVTDPQTLAQGGTLTFNFDVYWPFNPSPAPSGTFTRGTSTFGFSANPEVSTSTTQYQVLVANAASASIWSSAWSSQAGGVQWNGNAGSGANPGGTAEPAGLHYYLVKFSNGGNFGGSNYYGQTKWVPFTLQ